MFQDPLILLTDLFGRYPALIDLEYLPDKVDCVFHAVARITFHHLSQDRIHLLVDHFITLLETLKIIFGLYWGLVVKLASFVKAFSDLDIIFKTFSVD